MNQNECFVHQSGTPTTFSRLAGWKGAKGMTFSQHNAKSKMSLKNCYPSSKCGRNPWLDKDSREKMHMAFSRE